MNTSSSSPPLPPCCGLLGTIFGHRFKARTDSKQDYPPNTMQGLQATILATVQMGSANIAFLTETLGKICDGYRCMDISTDTYIHDVCTRCGATIQRPSA